MDNSHTATVQTDVLPVLQSRDETRAFYNKIAKYYDLLAERSEQPIRDISFAKLAPKPGERILEIGFGTGHNLLRIAQTVGPDGLALGVDLAENMVAAARKNVAAAGASDLVELQCGEAEELPYEAGSLDAVVMNFTLELFDMSDIPKVLNEVRRVLRDRGRIVVAAISKEGKQDFVVHAFEWTHQHFPNLMDCRPIHVRQAIADAGFEIDETVLEHLWVPVEIVVGIKP